MYWVKQNGPTNPDKALENHLQVNNPHITDHLFAYQRPNGSGYQPLTKTKFIERLGKAARSKFGSFTMSQHPYRFHFGILALGNAF